MYKNVVQMNVEICLINILLPQMLKC